MLVCTCVCTQKTGEGRMEMFDRDVARTDRKGVDEEDIEMVDMTPMVDRYEARRDKRGVG